MTAIGICNIRGIKYYLKNLISIADNTYLHDNRLSVAPLPLKVYCDMQLYIPSVFSDQYFTISLVVVHLSRSNRSACNESAAAVPIDKGPRGEKKRLLNVHYMNLRIRYTFEYKKKKKNNHTDLCVANFSFDFSGKPLLTPPTTYII